MVKIALLKTIQETTEKVNSHAGSISLVWSAGSGHSVVRREAQNQERIAIYGSGTTGPLPSLPILLICAQVTPDWEQRLIALTDGAISNKELWSLSPKGYGEAAAIWIE